MLSGRRRRGRSVVFVLLFVVIAHACIDLSVGEAQLC